MREAAIGSWSSNKGDCKQKQTYSFSDDGMFMYAYSEDGFISNKAGDIENLSSYLILGESDRVIRSEIKGEYRTTESGDTVIWDMYLINDDEFCWHRTDWSVMACTASMYRCEDF